MKKEQSNLDKPDEALKANHFQITTKRSLLDISEL